MFLTEYILVCNSVVASCQQQRVSDVTIRVIWSHFVSAGLYCLVGWLRKITPHKASHSCLALMQPQQRLALFK
jgi:hypothetical protein